MGDANGTLRLNSRGGGQRKVLKVEAKVRFGDLVPRDAAGSGAVFAVFPDGTVCELEPRVRSGDVRYRLEVRERGGTVELKRGACTPIVVPAVVGDAVTIVHDADDDAGTPDTPILTGRF